MRKTINRTYIEGLLYQHNLELKTSGPNSKTPGTQFIAGNIEIVTDDAGLNVVPVHFTYVTETTSTGKPNATFTALMNIVNGVFKSVMGNGRDEATMLRVDSAIGLNEFYTEREGKEELVSAKRNEGGFVHTVTEPTEDEKLRNTFECDMIITNVRRLDADEEKNLPEKVIIKGFTFDFRGALLPIELSVLNPNAMNYFEGLEISEVNPVFTKVKGRQISEVIVKRIEEESAFGEPSVREVKNTRKDFVVTWAMSEPYIWDDESSITVAEFKAGIANRETYLATMKARQDEYKASKGTGGPINTTSGNGGFNF